MYEETELKFSLSPVIARKILRNRRIRSSKKGPYKKRRLVSTYFDTPCHALRKSGVAFRIRDNGTLREQTLKVPFQGPAGLQNFREWTTPTKSAVPNLSNVGDPELVRSFSRKRYQRNLKPVFTTDFERRAVRVKTCGTEFELAIDQGVIHAETRRGHVEEPICEAEFELLSGKPAQMFEIALQLCETYDMRLAHRTKAQRGYALARPSLRPKPFKAPKVVLSGDATVGEAFNFIISGALDHMFVNEIPALEGKPEGIHQMRVAMRRIRAALRAFKKILPYDKRKAFNGEFRWFQQRLAPARDWDVFLSETLPRIKSFYKGDSEMIERLRRIARRQRRRAITDVRECLVSRRYSRLMLQFERWITSLTEGGPFSQPVKPFAQGVLSRTWRYFLEDTRPLSRLPAEALHEVRKRGKKTRYATQFFSSLWEDTEVVRPFMKSMSRLQDNLGQANDATAARQIFATVKPGLLDSSTIRLIQNWSQARVTKCLRPAQPKWRALRRLHPFWET